MKYETKNNPLCTWYRSVKSKAMKRNSPICEEWKTWFGFAKWCEANGYDENTKLYYSPRSPFTPEYVNTERWTYDGDFEYIAYSSDDPYELIIASAPRVVELSDKLKRLGYDYNWETITMSLVHNKRKVMGLQRKKRLIFERIDLSNYNEDDEPFEEK